MPLHNRLRTLKGVCATPAKLEDMKIATWNINSIRARENRVEDWLNEHDVDVLALQETKTKDETFPFASSNSWATRLHTSA